MREKLVAALLLLALVAGPTGLGNAAPAPERTPTQTPLPGQIPIPVRIPPSGATPPPGHGDPTTEDFYRAIIRATAARSPADTLGNGIFTLARSEFYAGHFNEANRLCQEFTKGYARNLNVDDALEMILLIREYRDFEDLPLAAYARALSYQAVGAVDSATTIATAALARYPGAAVRYHLQFQLAEMASERGDHATALKYAIAVSDTSSKSRLSPAALKLAGDETLALGQGAPAALKYYQALLERYPNSPLTPGVRAQVIEMRKRLQL